ncbi:MAG: DUF1800 family protein [Pseudomonadota bacterium]
MARPTLYFPAHHHTFSALSLARSFVLVAFTLLAGCGGGGSSEPGGSPTTPPALVPPADPPVTAPAPTLPDNPPATVDEGMTIFGSRDAVFTSRESTSRFLSLATFGATEEAIASLVGTRAERWFLDQLALEPTLMTPVFEEYTNQFDSLAFLPASPNTMGFWRHAVSAPDQLRQRMVFALSQILVVSDFGGELLSDVPSAVTYYLDALTRHALGNYRELLEEITYSPAMGHYLTYAGNLPADETTGRMPDENYAREILQLFSIGLVELNDDGSVKTNAEGQAVETYDNRDVTGLARVFTGLEFGAEPDDFDDESELLSAALSQPMTLFEFNHSKHAKTFLDTTIPPNTPGMQSVSMALDRIMAHPNVGPFIGRQLIQRFTTSHPTPAYIREVAGAFNSGRYLLPDNSAVGDGRKGDLSATIAAVLFSPEAHGSKVADSDTFGKPREPILRLTQWMRAFAVDATRPDLAPILYDLLPNELLGQHPYRSRSVFNFYRPGYVAPGSLSGAEGLTVPEFQITNASTNPGYVNVMTHFIFNVGAEGEELEELEELFDEFGLPLDEEQALQAFIAGYERERALSSMPGSLIDHLDMLLAAGQLTDNTRDEIARVLDLIPDPNGLAGEQRFEAQQLRTMLAVLMTMTAPEYLVTQ